VARYIRSWLDAFESVVVVDELIDRRGKVVKATL
jgi:hypothetical protein